MFLSESPRVVDALAKDWRPFGVFKRGSDGFGEGLSLLSEDLKVSGRCPELAGNSPATAPLAPTEPGHLIS